MPDFLKGEVADHSWVPPDTEEKMKAFSAFIEGPASIEEASGAVAGVLEDVREKSGGRIAKWGALGFCWGYKVCFCFDYEWWQWRLRPSHFDVVPCSLLHALSVSGERY